MFSPHRQCWPKCWLSGCTWTKVIKAMDRFVPGSHKAGCLSPEEIAIWTPRPSVICTVPRGGAIVMRPLLLHASSSCSRPEPRRVVHLEFAADDLPDGLDWHDRV